MVWMSLLSVITAGNLALSIYNLGINGFDDGKECYTLYVGTNDKDAYKPEISSDEAFSKVEAVCVKYLEGATFDTARGI